MSIVLDPREVLAGTPRCRHMWDFNHNEDLTEFTGTAISSGTVASQAGAGGWLRLSGVATTDDTGYQIQGENPSVDIRASGLVTYVQRHLISSIDVEWWLGLAVLDTSIIASAPSDAIYLRKPEDIATVYLGVRRASGTAVEVDLGLRAVAGSFATWGIQVRSDANPRRARIQVYHNGIQVFDDPLLFTNIPDDQVLTPSLAMQSGSATGTQALDCDYIFLDCDR